MNLTGGIVLFAVIWFMVFFIVLPIRFQSQDEAGQIVPGTPPGAPHNPQLGRKARITSAIAVVLWAVIAGIILSGVISIEDLDFFGRLAPR